MKKLLISSIIIAGLIATGCNLGKKPAPTPIAPQPTPQPTPIAEINDNGNQPKTNEISLLISTEDSLKYCNGADMDSAGYKKTLTKEIKMMNFDTSLTQAELIRKALIWAAGQSQISFPQADNENYIKIVNDTAYIQPTEGWAGVSIALCSWQPFVEVNVPRFPGIKKVVWEGTTMTEPTPSPTPVSETKENPNEITMLVSTANASAYCNGADMDSAGYKKTLTKQITMTNAETGLNQAELIRKSLAWAAGQSGLFFTQVESENYIKVINNTAYIQPSEGYAGVAIDLCTWQPFVEVNALRFPGIKKVEWVDDMTKWQNL